MARPAKDGIDYFPMDIDFFADMKVRRIKKDCGPASISILICLLCNIYRDGYCIRLNEDLTFFTAETIGVTEGAVLEVIKKSVQVDFFNKSMFDKYAILTSKGIQKRFLNAVKTSKLKRNGIHPDYDLFQYSEELAESSEETPDNTEEYPKNPEESTQSKVKQRKAKKSKVFVPPTLQQIADYCQERKNSVDPQRFFDYFDTSGWVDSEGKSVQNWKQKIITWEGRRSGQSAKPTQSANPTYTKSDFLGD